MCDIFSCVQEEGSEENSSDTMDYQEFVLAMAACAVYMGTLERKRGSHLQPAIEMMNDDESRNDHSRCA